jgi:hypothetical protein
MSPAERALYERLRRRAATLQPELARRLFQAYEAIRQALTEAELVDAIERGYVEQLLANDVLDPALSPLRSTLQDAVVDAARRSALDLPRGVRSPSFDVLNPRVIEAARDLSSRVVSDMRTDVRDMVRVVVTQGIADGQNPRETARFVKRYVGLSARYARAVETFRLELEIGDPSALNRVLGRGVIRQPDGSEITRRAHADQQGLLSQDIRTLRRKLGQERLTPKQIERMTTAYQRRLLAVNAEAVTRTMALDAMRAGQRGSWEDAIAQGAVDRSTLRRTWVAVDDERTRPEHAALDGTEVLFDLPYPNGEMVPGESTYGCRCIERITIAREAQAV